MQIDNYEIKEVLGEGGMSLVYRAQDKRGRVVVVKVLHPSLAISQDFHKRFEKEISIARNLDHPNIVRVLDSGLSNDRLFLTMKFMSGGDLSARIAKGLSVHQALAITADVASALQYAHDQGLIHRDIKPGNVLFDHIGKAYLTDFGIAKVASATTSLTRTGAYLGTPYYMSPEQARGRKIDSRADIYSLGILLYEMLTGHKPYNAEDHFAVALMHINDAIPELPIKEPRLQDLLDRCLAKDPEDRFKFADDVATEAKQLLEKLPLTKIAATSESMRPKDLTQKIKKKKSNPVLAMLSVTALSSLGVFGYLQKDKIITPEFLDIIFENTSEFPTGTKVELDTGNKSEDTDNRLPIKEAKPDFIEDAIEEAVTAAEPEPTPSPSLEELKLAAQIQLLQEEINNDINFNRLTRPANSNALDKIKRLTSIDPSNTNITTYKNKIIDKYISLFRQALTDGKLASAEDYLESISLIQPAHTTLISLKNDLEATKNRRKAAEKIATETRAAEQKAMLAAAEAKRQQEAKLNALLEQLSLAESEINKENLDAARIHIENAEKIDGTNPRISNIKKLANELEALNLIREQKRLEQELADSKSEPSKSNNNKQETEAEKRKPSVLVTF